MPATLKRLRVHGRIDPDSLYTVEGVMRACGQGREWLLQARASKAVRPIPCGKRVYYRGSELIAWIESHSEGCHASNR